MASQVGNVSRDGMCAMKSTKCANGGVAMDGAKAWNSTERCTVYGGVGLGGLYAARECGNSDQHAAQVTRDS
ncbi:hypothetical protein B0G75_102320 [Paraburkholderia sp. BL18I3N2]|uniref:hypothetical protein n=1 Tax=Paraburkholderia sp. BL18I3N2 TaxID=1938799 RepID=UPI000D4C8AF8|nr:hypothetical protein [Paraburkholderia sp. BL18I3N2]PRX34290.1 hypothetical protein B0G75_102320 [Paraburkholderia sp. BL18I3N2]